MVLLTFQKWVRSSDKFLGSMTEKMRAKYDKYWGNIKNMNILIFVVVVLDP